MIASRVRNDIDSFPSAKSRNMGSEFRRNNANLKTVAVLPVSRNVPIDVFARKLHSALESIGSPTSYLNQASISNTLGKHAFTRMGKLKTAAWLADQEQRYKIVLYVADSSVGSSWTQTCVRQADYVLVVGLCDDPSMGEYERLLLSMKTTARKELVLLHPDRSVAPGSTREWLKVRTHCFLVSCLQFLWLQTRPWVHQHIHVELPVCAPNRVAVHYLSKFTGTQNFGAETYDDSPTRSCCSSSSEEPQGQGAKRNTEVSW